MLLAWPVGGLLAAGAAWIIGKTALGLRSDYLAIATLGISEIIIAILRNEDWMTRGVKNVAGIPRPVPYEIDLQASEDFVNRAANFGLDPKPFIFAVCYAASASFITPVGYQTNLMVFGPGGYRYSDYIKVGLPLGIILWIISVIMIPMIWPF